ncbi:S-adenosyl-L-methionine-dependent methyltransferase [Conidiobolus coronatus NRRL 28638]|uniref:NOL1/NOP2/Sun domain family member 4 n=1 Tax=Conidiobolus coronatus (strain ATCC 28846 / CBS 209.66 / NRRL 28638) TaxID=796925 RepID=A0A137P622_CONC2|nr:S-adenosyl-L-methionine-dependent methyltransferase [Conidiobolus coronatus NRRL 28638]|eukprot:KXN70436.1 S-adenosyl-L-methionine-dependent methyltransferase [Conidiobolus coronatus NRRL 28638]
MGKDQKVPQKSAKGFIHYYSNIYGQERWSTLIKALFKPTRHACLINLPTITSPQTQELLKYPDSLEDITTLHRISQEANNPFPSPQQDEQGVFTHYLLDAASLLPVQALNIENHHDVLDLCAAPGGKSVAIGQYLLGGTGSLHSNEVSRERFHRLKNVLHSYFQPTHAPPLIQFKITQTDGTKSGLFGINKFDRILLDAPCSTERHVLHSPQELSSWSTKLTKFNADRQFSLIQSAWNMLKPGGQIVYATCSLSPLENDDIVDRLKRRFGEEVEVNPVSFQLGEATKYGWVCLPDTAQGFGPLYFCNIRKNTDYSDGSEDDDDDEVSDVSST